MWKKNKNGFNDNILYNINSKVYLYIKDIVIRVLYWYEYK